MIYKRTQRIWSFGDDFHIQDSEGNAVFLVDGRAFSIGDKLSFQDMAGNELAFISQRIFSLKTT